MFERNPPTRQFKAGACWERQWRPAEALWRLSSQAADERSRRRSADIPRRIKERRFIMAPEEVYSVTTTPNPDQTCCLVPSEYLDKRRFIVKILEVVLSLVAFILEEVVLVCINCAGLEFFEFVSCTSFLFTMLLLVLLSTTFHRRVGITSWSTLDFVYTLVIAFFFLIASIVFATINSGTSLEKGAVALGFLATLAYGCDLFLFWRTYGHPFAKGDKRQPSNGVQPTKVDQEAPAETEKLNVDTTQQND
ncbi:CKLF-like MARVEL transmembrane domain-containing protein 6 isoform X2 [Syngnathoides biaculeatus]|uniref:CKLF-like MARVEL transmembrane domain-containing protein 6 isoform X2 n=1 Tax=Syngnathoides biaculeatus TaxID=300417 RepID=UPI002ADE3FD1|nr:CKLF-like MARVEL transmembrane domain-containing protein 6 isoform X2 [Syngnathoides biaculeatus]